MPHRLGLLNWLWEALKALGAWLGSVLFGLVTVETVGPHIAAVLVTAGEFFVAWLALPEPERVDGKWDPVQRRAYRDARNLLFRKRRRRLALLASTLFVLIVASNVIPGAGDLDSLFSVAYVAAVVLHTLNTLKRADEVFRDPIEAIHRVFSRPFRRSHAQADSPANGTTGDVTSPSEHHRGQTHVGS